MTSADPWLNLAVSLRLGRLALDLAFDPSAPAVALVGPSGSGKSTVLRIIAGLERRARGTVRCRGEVWQDERGMQVPVWSRRLGWIPQEALLFPHLDVRQNLTYGAPSTDGLTTVADLLEIGPLLDRRPRHLSGGERQRVSVGRALLSNPRLLLLDEPFAAMDRPLRQSVGLRLREYCAPRGIPYLLVSHDERDVEALADEVWGIQSGSVVPLGR